MSQRTRYSGAILQDGYILLIQHHYFASAERWWLLPGGGREPGETEEETVRREMLEETGLQVRVERLLIEEFVDDRGVYDCYRTYLCTPVGGMAKPGYEPEPEPSAMYEIAALRWLPLSDESTWEEDLRLNPIMGPLLRKIREQLANG